MSSEALVIVIGLFVVIAVAVFGVGMYTARRQEATVRVTDDLLDEDEDDTFIAQADLTNASRAIFDGEMERAINAVVGEVGQNKELDLGIVVLARGGMRSRIIGDVSVQSDGLRQLQSAGIAADLPAFDLLEAHPGLENINLAMPITRLDSPMNVAWKDVESADIIDRTNVYVRFRLPSSGRQLYQRKLAAQLGQADLPGEVISPTQALLFGFDEGRYAFLMVRLIARLQQQPVS